MSLPSAAFTALLASQAPYIWVLPVQLGESAMVTAFAKAHPAADPSEEHSEAIGACGIR